MAAFGIGTDKARAFQQWTSPRQPTRQRRSAYRLVAALCLFRIPFLLLWPWFVPLRVQEATKAMEFALMGATTITEPTRTTIGGMATIPATVAAFGKEIRQGKAVAVPFPLSEFQKQPKATSEERTPFRNRFQEREPARQGRSGNGSERHHRTDNTSGNH